MEAAMKKPINRVLFVLSLLTASVLLFSNFCATGLAAEVSVIWDPNSESDLDGYAVYRSVGSPGSPFELVDDLSLNEIADPDHPEVTLTQLQEDTDYHFVVTAYDRSGNESKFSNQICLRIENGAVVDCTASGDSGGGGSGGGSGGGAGCFISTLADGTAGVIDKGPGIRASQINGPKVRGRAHSPDAETLAIAPIPWI
jgi:hypothetical protein